MNIIKRVQEVKKYYCFFIVVTVSIFSLYSVALSKSPKAPTLTIIEPSSNSVVMGVVNIMASATIGIVKMEFFIDGILLKIDYEPGLDGEWSTTWDTTRYSDGYHDIVAQATDNRGKTAVNHNSVIVNNLPNIPPVAALDYSWDGNKYYFYPYECNDPNGYIVKFQYTISKLDNSGYEDSYACCMYSYCNFSNDPVIADICRGERRLSLSAYLRDKIPGLAYSIPALIFTMSLNKKMQNIKWD